MPTIKTIDGIFDIITNIMIEQLTNVAEDVKQIMKHDIETLWYSRAGYEYSQVETKFYKRTYQFINALKIFSIIKNGNTVSIEIGFDYNAIDATDAEDKYHWSHHQSIINGSSFIQGLVETIMLGKNPSTIYGWNNTNILEEVKNEIKTEKLLLKAFERRLKQLGFTIKVN